MRFIAETQQVQGDDSAATRSLSIAQQTLDFLHSNADQGVLSARALIIEVRASTERDEKKSAAALDTIQKAINLWDQLSHAAPDNPNFAGWEGASEIHMCEWLYADNKFEEAARSCRSGVDRIERETTGSTRSRAIEGDGEDLLGRIAARYSNYPISPVELKHALDIYLELKDRGFSDYDSDIANSSCHLSLAEAHLGLAGPAMTDLERAVQISTGTSSKDVSASAVCAQMVHAILSQAAAAPAQGHGAPHN